ncbi:POK9 protein, partial [Peucedramus taeniatus]|nr:POK9 protein [Peucedramus taeniatus]
GSLGLDLAAAIGFTLIDTRRQRIPTGVYGALIINGKAVGALLIGCSSASMIGLQVLTGVIDADYTGEIQIMVQTLFPPLFVEKGTRLTQLVLLPVLTGGLTPKDTNSRGQGSFGSTGSAAMLTVNLRSRPRHTVSVAYQGQIITLTALLDASADVSIIS